jgi:hypothetical protein
MKQKMILVKNFNIFFVIVVVVILNLINGLQFNQTPVGQDIAGEPVGNDITKNEEASRPHIITQEELSPPALSQNSNQTPGQTPTATTASSHRTHSGLDEVTDFDELSEEEQNEVLKRNVSESSSSNTENVEESQHIRIESEQNPEVDC